MGCSAWSFSLYSVFVVLFEVFLPALELSGNSGFTVLLMPVAGKGRLVPGSIPSDYAAPLRNGVSESWRELLTKVFLLWRRVTKLHTQSVPCLGFGMLKYSKSGKKFVDKSQIIWKWTGFGQCEFKVLKNPAKTFLLGTDIWQFWLQAPLSFAKWEQWYPLRDFLDMAKKSMVFFKYWGTEMNAV